MPLSINNDSELTKALQQPAGIESLVIDRVKDVGLIERIAEFEELKSLNVSMTDARPLVPHLHRLKNLRLVSFQRCDLDEFPVALQELQHIEDLRLGNNSIETLPAEIGQLKNLQSLYVAQNNLTEIPDSLYQCPLKVLGLSHNRIQSLPQPISGLSETLEMLSLSANRLSALPSDIGNLRKLSWLSLDFNQLRTLPECIVQLESLQGLTLVHNPFDSLPVGLESLVKQLENFEINSEHRPLFMDWSWKPSEMPVQKTLEEMQLMIGPEDSFHDSVATALREIGADDYLSRVTNTIEIRPTTPFEKYDVPELLGCSRLGGFPDLVNDGAYPRTEGGARYTFLGQINLTDVAEMNEFLPAAGLLSFFLPSLESFEPAVIYYSGDLIQLTSIRFDPEELCDVQDDFTRSPHQIKFKRVAGLPMSAPENIDYDVYDKTANQFRSAHPSQINGDTATQHESPQEQAANQLGGRSQEWINLLKLDSVSEVGFCFWDAGTLTFMIHQEDLRRHDFSRMHVSLESS